jgi:uncharacterized protein
MRAVVHHVDEFRPIHNLASMGELCDALSGSGTLVRTPWDWLKG